MRNYQNKKNNLSNSKEKYINREISWLQFNERVLQEAECPSTPLIERIKFLGIFSNNLDEFFRVRVATIRRLASLDNKKLEKFDIEPVLLLKKINQIVKKQQLQFSNIYKNIVIDLKSKGIIILNEKTIKSKSHIVFIKDFFENKLRSHLFPIMLNEFNSKSILRDENTYLAILLVKKDYAIKEDYALIEVPTQNLPRIIVLPDINNGEKYLILLDDIIRFFLKDIFSMFDFDCISAYTVKITRDGELDIDNDISKSFIERIENSLKQRDTGCPVRFVYDKSIPKNLLQLVEKTLNVTKTDTIVDGGRYHNFKDFMEFPNIGSSDNYYSEFKPLPHPDLIKAKRLIDIIDDKDIMLTFPYQSFHYIIDILREASIHPDVVSIKMTVYRIAPNSKVKNALINAARNGKQVTVFMELQARFDEKINIYWSERLKEEGIKIINSIPGIKVHSKLIQIKKYQKNKEKFYSFIGTGNFNESTARIYSDNILMTSNPLIGEDVNKVFDMFEDFYRPISFKYLYVSPLTTRKFIENQLNKLIKASKNNKKAECIIKLNNLTDKSIVDKLYKASLSGVKIKLIIRGICVLLPNIPNLSENISAISIVDRFLEHSRILYFNINNKEEFYISSADFMERNLNNRVEVICPIFNTNLQKILKKQLDIQLSDNVKARIIDYKNSTEFLKNNKPKIRSQFNHYEYFKTKLNYD
jgi:polyphosphate kinase